MPGNVFSTSIFQPVEVQTLTQVFHVVCAELVSNNETFNREAAAAIILNLAQNGQMDPERLRQQALASIRASAARAV